MLLGYLWSHVVAIGSVAFRMNAMSGVAIAITALAAYEVAREIGAGRWVALFATLWFAFTQNVWAHAARAEAQDLAVACEAIAIYAFLRWMRTGEARWFAGAFALCGLAMAAHPNALWLLPRVADRHAGRTAQTVVAARRPFDRADAGRIGALPLFAVALGVCRCARPRSHGRAARRQRRHLLELQRPAHAARSRTGVDRQRSFKRPVISRRHSIRCVSGMRCGRS